MYVCMYVCMGSDYINGLAIDEKGDECIIAYELGKYSNGDDNRNI